MTKPNREPHPTGHIPGNADAIDGEVRRLDDLKERLWSAGETIRKLTMGGWDGPARDSFDNFWHRFAHQWLTTGDLHEDAARALKRYHGTLAELRRRAAGLDAIDPAATADMVRWREQLNSEARAAATAVRRAAQALASLPRLLNNPAIPAVADAAPTQPSITATQTRITIGESGIPAGLDPRTAQSDPTRFQRHVQALSDEILLAEFVAITPP